MISIAIFIPSVSISINASAKIQMGSGPIQKRQMLASALMFGLNTALNFLQKYKAYNSKVYISMSADANCLGIRSPHDGHIVMDLSKGILVHQK